MKAEGTAAGSLHGGEGWRRSQECRGLFFIRMCSGRAVCSWSFFGEGNCDELWLGVFFQGSCLGWDDVKITDWRSLLDRQSTLKLGKFYIRIQISSLFIRGSNSWPTSLHDDLERFTGLPVRLRVGICSPGHSLCSYS